MEKADSDLLNKVLFGFSKDPQDGWTVDDATKGVSIIGGTGSGKTSASGRKLALSFLKENWGGLVLCAKTEEVDLWREYCDEAKRTDDLLVFSYGRKHEKGDYEGQKMIFNPIDYEMQRASDEGGGQTINITNIFMNIYRMGNRIAGENDVREERYWDSALKRCLNRIIELIKLAKHDLTYSNMVKVLATSDFIANERYENALDDFQNGIDIPDLERDEYYCIKCLINALQHMYAMPEGDAKEEAFYNFDLVEQYFVFERPTMDEKTKSIVRESFLGLAEPFLSGLLHEHFSGKTNIYPEETYTQGKIIVLDFSIKKFLDVGIVAQCVFKLMFQQTLERRNTKLYPNPVFLWCDEAQYFVNPYDQIFLTTARSSRTATVFLSQNISNYFAVIGSKPKVDSLMGNLCTKIFHANTDAETNEYASRLIGSVLAPVKGSSESHSDVSLSSNYSKSLGLQYLPQVYPKEFSELKTGGDSNEKKVQSIIVISGKQWSSGENYFAGVFDQNFSLKL